MLTSNPEIVYMGIIILCIDVVLEVGRAVNILSVNVLNAVGDVSYPFVTGLIVMWGVATALSYVFGIFFGWGLADDTYFFRIVAHAERSHRGLFFLLMEQIS